MDHDVLINNGPRRNKYANNKMNIRSTKHYSETSDDRDTEFNHGGDHVVEYNKPKLLGKKKSKSPVAHRNVDSPVQKYKAQSSLDQRTAFKLKSIVNH
jgi:hypothetical protein